MESMKRPPNCSDRTCGECFRCHIQSIQISPAALPTRRNKIAPAAPRYNSYEKGEPRDARGMPYLGSDMQPMSQKTFDANRRRIEEAKRTPAPPTTT